MFRILSQCGRGLAVAVALCALSQTGLAAGAPPVQVAAVSLSDQDRKDLRRIENYLNSIRTLQANFIQTSDQGSFANGRLIYSRPDKFRFQYDDIPVLMVSNHGQLNYYDSEKKEFSNIPLSATPLWFLARDIKRFDDQVRIIGIQREKGVLRVGVVQADDPEAGQVVLTFSTTPIELRKWSITDAQGATVHVALYNTHKNRVVDETIFDFEIPTEPGGK